MSHVTLQLVAWLLLLLVVLTLFLIGQVNQLIRVQGPLPLVDASAAQVDVKAGVDVLFVGLQGRRLWGAMSGRLVDGLDSRRINALRPHYEPILRQHIADTFKDGLEDAHAGDEQRPASLRSVATSRGRVDSWLPPQYLGCIYRIAVAYAGHARYPLDAASQARLRQTLDRVVALMYQRAGLRLDAPLSALLLDPERLGGTPLAQASRTASTPAAER